MLFLLVRVAVGEVIVDVGVEGDVAQEEEDDGVNDVELLEEERPAASDLFEARCSSLVLASGGSAAVVRLHPAGSSLLNGCGPTSGALSRRRVPLLLLSYGTHGTTRFHQRSPQFSTSSSSFTSS